MVIIRLPWMRIPDELKLRKKEILGEIQGNMMRDCVYNNLLVEPVESSKISVETLEKLIEKDPHLPQLKKYQVADLCRTLTMDKVFNKNKPGMGKTLETIIWMKYCLEKGSKILVLCPKTVIPTWTEQLQQYWPTCYKDCTVWVTNYEQLYDEERSNIAFSMVWDLVVLDESHKIKSMKSKITDTVFRLKSKARHCLTGTPIKNRPEDLAAQLKWLDPYSITNFTDFKTAFCYQERNGWGFVAKGLTKDKIMVANLQKLLDIYCVGGSEVKIEGMPEPQRIMVGLKMDEKVRALYKKVEGERIKLDDGTYQKFIDTEALLEEGIKVSSDAEAAVRRQQLASNPQLFNPEFKNIKFDWILEWLEGSDEKVIIMSKYSKTIDALVQLLIKKKIDFAHVARKHNLNVRRRTIETWKLLGTRVLLGTYGVLSEGVDGLQYHCHYMICIDRLWTASGNEQAEGRIVRTGQTKQPIIYVLQAKGTIDKQVERMQLDKGHDVRELLTPIEED